MSEQDQNIEQVASGDGQSVLGAGGEGGQPPAATPASGKTSRSRRRVLAILGVILLAVIALNAYYLLTRQPITSLPVVRAVAKTTPPTYLFSISGLSEPFGVAVSPDGQRIYVTETGGARMVRVFDRSGKQLLSFTLPGTAVPDRAPAYPAVDSLGRVYVPERKQNVIAVYSPEGRHLGIFPKVQEGDKFIWAPLGVSVNDAGEFLVTDTTVGEHQVWLFDASGQMVTKFGKEGSGDGEFEYPNMAVMDHRSRIYVTDGSNGRVGMFDKDGKLLGYLGTGNAQGSIGLPRGLAIDTLDRLYAVDNVNGRIQVFDAGADKPNYLFTLSGGGDKGMMLPNGIATDSTGRIYVASTGAGEVQVWTY